MKTVPQKKKKKKSVSGFVPYVAGFAVSVSLLVTLQAILLVETREEKDAFIQPHHRDPRLLKIIQRHPKYPVIVRILVVTGPASTEQKSTKGTLSPSLCRCHLYFCPHRTLSSVFSGLFLETFIHQSLAFAG